MTAYVWRSVRATKIHLKLVWKQQNTIQANEQIAILRLTLPIDSYKRPLIFYIFQTESIDVEQIEGILNRHGGTNHINRESVTTGIYKQIKEDKFTAKPWYVHKTQQGCLQGWEFHSSGVRTYPNKPCTL